jgi:3-hydroxyisobutyrate dehydrogenase-like beta-hydroxyacid dehydrogenase
MVRSVGFIGLGMMGHGIAANILKNGYSLMAMAHRNRGPLENLIGKGAVEAATPAELAARCDAVFLCVRGGEEVEEVVYGENGLLNGCHPGLIVVDCTTSQPGLSRRIAGDLKKRNASFADAPVTRAPKDAEAGRLNSLVGAEDETFATIKPILETYSENIAHFGPPGAGHSAKLINNFISCGYTALIIEGMALCSRAGVNAEKLYETMAEGGANSGVLRKLVPPLLKGDLTGHQFSLGNAHKDVSYFCTLAEEYDFKSVLAKPLQSVYRSAVDAGLAERFMASLIELHQTDSDEK